MKKIIVVGGGPAGLFAAITAAERGATVTVLEKMDRTCKKLLITGKGRCNITNDEPLSQFKKNFRTDQRYVNKIFSAYFSGELLTFFKELGVEF